MIFIAKEKFIEIEFNEVWVLKNLFSNFVYFKKHVKIKKLLNIDGEV